MKMINLPDEGILTLVSGILGLLALLVMFGCSTGSQMYCDSLLAEEKDRCLEDVRNRNNNVRYQMETGGSLK